MEEHIKMGSLISLEMLQKVQEHFSTAVGIALITVDELGVPVTKQNGFSPFCMAMRNSEEGRKLCYRCDACGGRRAAEQGKPYIYRCHAGLVDFAIPIIVNDQYLGAILAGQVRVEPDLEDSLDYIIGRDDTWKGSGQAEEHWNRISMVPYQKLYSAAYSLFYVASYIVEQGYINAAEKELIAKNLKLMEESKRRTELEKSLREAELKALHYQVNPHFLFNVLNTIGRLALLEKAESTETIVYAFADMMRYILRQNNTQLVTIRSEIEHVQNYLRIQKARLGDRLHFSVSVPARYNTVRCPFMILQPIVENCINYAVEPREEDGVIEISAEDNGTDLIVTIRDNGDGVSEERLMQVFCSPEKQNAERVSIGLYNVDSRLRRYFGENYGIVVESTGTPGGGTSVRMTLPLVFESPAV